MYIMIYYIMISAIPVSDNLLIHFKLFQHFVEAVDSGVCLVAFHAIRHVGTKVVGIGHRQVVVVMDTEVFPVCSTCCLRGARATGTNKCAVVHRSLNNILFKLSVETIFNFKTKSFLST